MELCQPWQNVNGTEQIFSGLCGNHNCYIFHVSRMSLVTKSDYGKINSKQASGTTFINILAMP